MTKVLKHQQDVVAAAAAAAAQAKADAVQAAASAASAEMAALEAKIAAATAAASSAAAGRSSRRQSQLQAGATAQRVAGIAAEEVLQAVGSAEASLPPRRDVQQANGFETHLGRTTITRPQPDVDTSTGAVCSEDVLGQGNSVAPALVTETLSLSGAVVNGPTRSVEDEFALDFDEEDALE